MNHFANAEVASIFKTYPDKTRKNLMMLRKLIFDTAAETEGVGELEETLKWGEPAYLTMQSKSGSTIRINSKKADPTQYALYFNCQTDLVDTFRSLFPTDFVYEDNRSIVFNQDDKIPVNALRQCISIALTYHRNK